MKISLLSAMYPDLGTSTISPLLKRDGHSVKLLTIPQLLQDCTQPLSKKLVRVITSFLANEDLIGINSLSENYLKTASLVDDIKRSTDTPIIWGGIHATLKPEDCIRHADIVCVGEGEETMLELVKKMEKNESLNEVKNLLFRSGWDQKKNVELRSPVDLNSLLPLDYELETRYMTENDRIRNVRESDHKGTFTTFSSRSCPYRCTYCCNALIQDIYKGQKFLRQRSFDKVIDDIKMLKERFPSCRVVWFNEADFLSGKTKKDIEYFSNRYKKEIDIPFTMWTHPRSITDENIRFLKQAGLAGVNIGTVNASEYVQRTIYKRNANPSLYREKGFILNKYAVKTEYDFILCNPYENEDDVVGTITLLMSLPKPFYTVVYILTYFQKTELYNRALKDGLLSENMQIEGYTKAAYRAWKMRNNDAYLNAVASMMRGRARRIHWLGIDVYGILPDFVLRVLIKKSAVSFVKKIPFISFLFQIIGNMIMFGEMLIRKAKQLSGGPLF